MSNSQHSFPSTTDPAETKEQLRYWSFVSHSRIDQEYAKKLVREIEHFALPRPYRKKLTSGLVAPLSSERGRRNAKHLRPIFRDADELPASNNIGEVLFNAIATSASLTVICSPSAAKSEWVEKEIADYKSVHGEEGIFAVVVSGTPNAKSGGQDECFPPALRAVDEDRFKEPLFCDLRPGQESLYEVVTKIIAGILRLQSVDELRSRHKKQRRRKQVLSSTVGAILLFILGGLMWFSLDRFNASQLSNVLADVNNAKFAIRAGDPNEAIRLVEVSRTNRFVWDERRSAEADFLRTAATLAADKSRLGVSFALRAGSANPVRHIEFSRNGRIFVATSGRHLQVFTAANNELLFSFEAPDEILSAAISPDAKHMVIGLEVSSPIDDTKHVVLKTATGTVVQKSTHQFGSVRDVDFFPDSQGYATASDDMTIALWRIGELDPYRVLKGFSSAKNGHSPNLYSIDIDWSGSQLAAGSTFGEVLVWRIDGHSPPLRLVAEDLWSVANIEISQDGEAVAAFGEARGAKSFLWNLAQPEDAIELVGHERPVVYGTFSDDGNYVATASVDNRVILWDRSGRTLTRLEGHEDRLGKVIAGPNLQFLSYSSGRFDDQATNDRSPRLWQFGNFRALAADLPDGVTSAAFHPTERRVIIGTRDGQIVGYAIPTGDEWHTLVSTGSQLFDIGISPDGKLAAVGSANGDVAVFSVEGSSQTRTLSGHDAGVVRAAFLTDDLLLTASKDGSVLLRSLARPDDVKTYRKGHEGPVWNLLLDRANGQFVVSSEAPHAVVRDPSTDEERLLGKNEGELYSIALSPDGRFLATGGKDEKLVIHDFATGEVRHVSEPLGSWVEGIAFSADGHLVAAKSGRIVYVWWVESFGCVAELSHVSHIRDFDFSPDGRSIVTVSSRADTTPTPIRCRPSASIQNWTPPDGVLDSNVVRAWEIHALSLGPVEVPSWEVGPFLLGTIVNQARVFEEDSCEEVTKARHTKDGRILVVLYSDGEMVLFDARVGRPLHKLTGHGGPIVDFKILDDNSMITSSHDGKVMRWNTAPALRPSSLAVRP